MNLKMKIGFFEMKVFVLTMLLGVTAGPTSWAQGFGSQITNEGNMPLPDDRRLSPNTDLSGRPKKPIIQFRPNAPKPTERKPTESYHQGTAKKENNRQQNPSKYRRFSQGTQGGPFKNNPQPRPISRFGTNISGPNGGGFNRSNISVNPTGGIRQPTKTYKESRDRKERNRQQNEAEYRRIQQSNSAGMFKNKH